MENIELAQMEALYKSFLPKEGEAYTKCAYCKAIATERDHVIPMSWLSTIGGRRHFRDKDLLVAACRECNSMAGDYLAENFWERKRYVRKRVQFRHRKLLAMEDWTDKEIEELDSPLREYLFYALKVRNSIRVRLDNLDKPELFE